MKIRLMGSPQEVESGIQRIKEIFPVISISREYPNRNSADVRVYMEVMYLPAMNYHVKTVSIIDTVFT